MFERKKVSPSGMIENGLKKGLDIRVLRRASLRSWQSVGGNVDTPEGRGAAVPSW
jgi:hypothetical protein